MKRWTELVFVKYILHGFVYLNIPGHWMHVTEHNVSDWVGKYFAMIQLQMQQNGLIYRAYL